MLWTPNISFRKILGYFFSTHRREDQGYIKSVWCNLTHWVMVQINEIKV